MKKLLFALLVVLIFTLAACNGDGESDKVTVTFMNEGVVYSEVEIDQGAQVAQPTPPTREGYEFVGWYTEMTGGLPYNFTLAVEADLTLHARWEEEIVDPDPDDEYLFNYDWEEVEWNGEQAFSDGEGDNFLIMDGYAHTITNQGVIGPASAWAFGYTPYDMGIGEATIEARVIFNENAVEGSRASFSIRHLYAMHYDLQIFFENDSGYTGVRFYNSPTNILGDSKDISKGGQLSDQRFVENVAYVVKLIYVYTDETTTDVYVYVNDILEIYLTNVDRQNINSKFGIGASIHTSLKVDYFRAYETDPESLTTPMFSNITLFRGFEFDDESGTSGASILGDSYAEGMSFATDGEGYLRTLVDAEGNFGPAPGWSSARTGYDMGIPANYILQMKVRAVSENPDAVMRAGLRPSHAIYCDFQFKFTNSEEEAAVYVYKQGALWASVEGLTFGLNEDHVLTIVYTKLSNDHPTSAHGTYLIQVFINNHLVLTIDEAESPGSNASIALFAIGESDIMIDYFRIYGFGD